MSASLVGFRVSAGAPGSGVVLHVPHASTRIPGEVRAGIALDDRRLGDELARMTDHFTDLIATLAQSAARVRPWVFTNALSRLVIDPERFPDDREVMEQVAVGAVYTRTHDGRPLRFPDEADRGGTCSTATSTPTRPPCPTW